MNQEQEFSEFVHRHKSTIYTVCYMFSKDNDEVQDLFQNIPCDEALKQLEDV